MIALLSMSPEGYVFLVGALLFLCTICLAVLAFTAYLRTTRPEVRYPTAPIAPKQTHLRSIGGTRVSSADRWAA